MSTRTCPLLRRLYKLSFPSCRFFSDQRFINGLNGVYPPIAVPFNEDQSIAYDKLEANFRIWNSIPFRGYVVFGSNGEVVHLSFDEKIEFFKKVRKLVGRDKLLVAGVGCNSTLATLKLNEQIAKLGADVSLVVTPGYYKTHMTRNVLFNFYKEIADANILPVILYNVPANTGVDMPAELIIELAQHPNIIGLKDSGGDIVKMATIVSNTKSMNFQVLAGSASFLLPAYTIGAVGGICALANVLGKAICDLHENYNEGNLGDAENLQFRLIQPNTAVTKQYGVSGLKYAMDLKGYYGGMPRRPLLPLPLDDKKVLQTYFEKSGF
uniref:4-hydroxy-2-oxoglutarate aldolase, mitochondrial n=1 Tax=Strigamia maritima TaxID=126957 RepID=T1JG58_STRMM